jgi:hypothetical protein
MHLDLWDISWLGIMTSSMNFLIIILAFAKAPSFMRFLNLCLAVAIQAKGSLNLRMAYLNSKLDLPLCLTCRNSSATDYISVLPPRLDPESLLSSSRCTTSYHHFHVCMQTHSYARTLGASRFACNTCSEHEINPPVHYVAWHKFLISVLPTANVSCTTSHLPLILNPQCNWNAEELKEFLSNSSSNSTMLLLCLPVTNMCVLHSYMTEAQ